MTSQATPTSTSTTVSPSGSSRAAAGIALSRSFGLIREVLIAATFGIGGIADAFRAAMRVPNVIQNLLGEGALGASFVPVYARLLEERNEAEARRVAGGVLGMLTATVTVVVALLVLLADPLISIFAPGLTGETHDLAVSLMRLTSLGIGLLGISAWCLSILTSHRQYFLGYAAPALWNLAQITLLAVVGVIGLFSQDGGPDADRVARWLAYAVLVGSFLQLAVMVPRVRTLTRNVTPHLRPDGETRTVLRRFGPAVGARGVVQLSSFIDLFLASLLVNGALAIIGLVLPLYLLPVSIFGFSVATAELTEMSRRSDRSAVVAGRVELGLRKVALSAGLSTVVLCFGGGAIAATLYQWPNELLDRNSISGDDAAVLGLTLVAYGLALPATMTARVTQNALYAMGDVIRPFRIAVARLLVMILVASLVIFQADRLTIMANGDINGWDRIPHWPLWEPLPAEIRATSDAAHLGPVGLGLATLVSSWVEWALLRGALRRKLGRRVHSGLVLPISAAALGAGVLIAAIQMFVPLSRPLEGVAIGVVALAAYIGALRFQGLRPRGN